MGKRVGTSVLGIPILVMVGLSCFVVFSIAYDFIVSDTSFGRLVLLVIASLILLISVGLNMVKLETIKKISSRQLGNS